MRTKELWLLESRKINRGWLNKLVYEDEDERSKSIEHRHPDMSSAR